MATLREARETQDRQLEILRALQRDKSIAPPERKEAIQRQIDILEKQVRDLDTEIQRLINEGKPKRLLAIWLYRSEESSNREGETLTK